MHTKIPKRKRCEAVGSSVTLILFSRDFLFAVSLLRQSFETKENTSQHSIQQTYKRIRYNNNNNNNNKNIFKDLQKCCPACNFRDRCHSRFSQVGECTLISRCWTLSWNYCKSSRKYNYPFGGSVE